MASGEHAPTSSATYLSHTNGEGRRWVGGAGGARKASRQGAKIEATVESVWGLSEVAMGVLGQVEGVLRAAQGMLEVAQEGIDRAELRQLGAGLAATGDDALVVRTDPLRGAEALQTVGDHGGGRRDRALAAKIGVVHLDPAVEQPGVLTPAHDLHELVLHEPGGLVANSQKAHQLECGDVVLGLGQQVDGQEPERQRQLGLLSR